jgi:hypothetical protein
MKKALLGTFVTLLVIAALVSCDDVVGGSGKYAPNGQMVEVSINNNMGRSITNQFAKDETNYVEVIFSKGGKYYLASGFWTLPLTVTIPVGNYVAADAILLLGKRVGSDYTLLATGVLTGNPTNLSPLEVKSDTTNISFTVTSIETFLSADAATPSFEIDETVVAIDGTDFEGETTNGVFNGSKCFQVPANKTGLAASLSFTGFAATGANIIMEDTPVVTFAKISGGVTDITPTGILPTTDMSGGKISFTFSTFGLSDSEYKITFKAPVIGFEAGTPSNGLDKAITWNIRGGTSSTFSQGLDLGDDPTEADGVVLITRTTLDAFATPGITPTWP